MVRTPQLPGHPGQGSLCRRRRGGVCVQRGARVRRRRRRRPKTSVM